MSPKVYLICDHIPCYRYRNSEEQCQVGEGYWKANVSDVITRSSNDISYNEMSSISPPVKTISLICVCLDLTYMLDTISHIWLIIFNIFYNIQYAPDHILTFVLIPFGSDVIMFS